MPRTAGWVDALFSGLHEPNDHDRRRADDPLFGIGDLAQALHVPARRIRRWIRNREFPETPYWHEGQYAEAHRRRYTRRMIEAAVTAAHELGLDNKRRWDLAESDFGDRVATAWYRMEQPDHPWSGRRGWPDAHPNIVIDLSTHAAMRGPEIATRSRSMQRDDRIIDLTTDEAREANNRGRPIYLNQQHS